VTRKLRGGDVLYGERNSSWNYFDQQSHLTLWYDEILRAAKFTDISLFRDCRSIHRPIHPIAEQYGVNVHVFEEGYVRPHWLTLEKYGVNGRSKLPRDPAWYLDRRGHTPPP
jgi:capsular polysaccharide export protein